jgi:endonuclease/exonuclease/phosphatase family metal-dependent hydrolase
MRPVSVLVRTWNVFHGNASPPGRRAHLEEMVRLACEDNPDVLCLQELPVWALRRLEEWSGMRTFGAVAARPRLRSAALGRAVTQRHHGLFRSAVSGQANAILLQRELRSLAVDSIVLNPADVRRRVARELALDRRARRTWARERRVCHAVRTETLAVANLHISNVRDARIRDAELLRAATFADSFAEPGDVLVLAGDFNVRPWESQVLEELTGPEWGFSPAIPGIDQILVRGATATTPKAWPDERRRLDRRLLSDHAPLEVTIE